MPALEALTDNRPAALLEDAGGSLDRVASSLRRLPHEFHKAVVLRPQRLADDLTTLAEDAEAQARDAG